MSLVEPCALQSGAADRHPNHIASATQAPGQGNEILAWKTASSRLSVNWRCHFADGDLSCIMSSEKPVPSAQSCSIAGARRWHLPLRTMLLGAYVLFACGNGIRDGMGAAPSGGHSAPVVALNTPP